MGGDYKTDNHDISYTGPVAHSVGTIVYYYEKQGKSLVRVSTSMQNYYAPDEIELFKP